MAVVLLEGCSALTELDLSDCGPCITDKVGASIGRHCHRMKTLVLTNAEKLGVMGLRAVAKGCKELQSLDLSDMSREGSPQ